MDQKKVAEPDYDFRMETLHGFNLTDRVFLSNEVLMLKCIGGVALISINSNEHEFAEGANFLLAEGMIFKVLECSSNFTIVVLRFSLHFFNAIYPMLPGKTIDMMMANAPDLYGKEEMELTDSIFNQLCLLYRKKEHIWRHKIVINLVLNYILDIYEQTYRYMKDQVPKPAHHRTFLIDRFYELVIAEHYMYRNIEYYAQRLNITSRYLYKICKESIQMTPKQCIDYIVSGTSKKLLLTTTLTNQQVAHELNFPDQTTFGQFFKRNVGMSPSEFRNKFK